LKGRQCSVLTVDKTVDRLQSIKMTPSQLEALGLKPDWQKHIDKKFIEKVLVMAEKNREALMELSKC
jgi:hypothetical protein